MFNTVYKSLLVKYQLGFMQIPEELTELTSVPKARTKNYRFGKIFILAKEFAVSRAISHRKKIAKILHFGWAGLGSLFGAEIVSSKPKPESIRLVSWDIQGNVEQALATRPLNQIRHGNNPGGPTVLPYTPAGQNLPQTRVRNTN
ncbi:hypothetical protein B0H11DRAFT_1920648 [Mycena galericulata]|nr:hypothetical protein B0H11DRAFT_1920648 [Mycena galericulata]